jgi:hypothetical protein
MSLSPICAVYPRRMRVLIILACHHVLVESGLHGLGSCATLVVPELGGKASKISLAQVIEGLDSIHPHPRPR